VSIERITPEDDLWPDCANHLKRVNMARWVIARDGGLDEGLVCLGYVREDKVIGHVSFKVQPIVCPATEWSGGEEMPVLNVDGHPLSESYVYTFAVEEKYRRQGIGRDLQLAALDWTRRLGCYQMRSWSSTDKPANYALKISLGFAIYPDTYETARGYPVSGVYFVKTVNR
jgi:GNAT superfamily N-acetyltransferase